MRRRAAWRASSSSESLRLRVRLVDGCDGQVAWAVAEDVPAQDVYRVLSALVERIATSMQASLTAREKRQVMQQPPASLDVNEMSLRALSLKHRFSPEANAEARRLLEEVLRRDAGFAPAWAYLGMAEGVDWLNQFSGPRRPELLARAVERLERAMTSSPLAPTYMHNVHDLPLWAVGRLDESAAAHGRALQVAPRYLTARIHRMLTLAEAGRVDEALAELATLRGGGLTDRQLESMAAAMFAASGAALAERRRAALRTVMGAAPAAR